MPAYSFLAAHKEHLLWPSDTVVVAQKSLVHVVVCCSIVRCKSSLYACTSKEWELGLEMIQ